MFSLEESVFSAISWQHTHKVNAARYRPKHFFVFTLDSCVRRTLFPFFSLFFRIERIKTFRFLKRNSSLCCLTTQNTVANMFVIFFFFYSSATERSNCFNSILESESNKHCCKPFFTSYPFEIPLNNKPATKFPFLQKKKINKEKVYCFVPRERKNAIEREKDTKIENCTEWIWNHKRNETMLTNFSKLVQIHKINRTNKMQTCRYD